MINYDDCSIVANDSDDSDDRDPHWLSQMFEYGFIMFIKLTSHYQASQLPQIIQDAIKGFNSPFFFPLDAGVCCQNGKEITG